MSTLSNEQREVAFHNNCEGALLVEASAGSGKTRILTERVRYLLTEHKDKFFSVLCLTFTNKAADEMQERLKDIPKLKERVYIGSFHEFCLNKILRTRYRDIELHELPHIFNDEDQRKIVEEVLYANENLKKIYEYRELSSSKRAKAQRELLSKCINFISEAKRKLIVVPEYEAQREGWTEERTYLFKEYNRRLVNQNAMDYDDILLYAYRILNARQATAELYRRNYKYIMIDEAQDLNYAQYQILRTLCGQEHRNVMMVGDPNQAIYGFNGSDPKYMQDYFIEDFGAEKKEIKKNYRSSQKVLEFAEKIQPNGGFKSNYFTGICEFHSFEDVKDEAQWIVSKIKEWEKAGQYKEADKEVTEPIALKNIAVLARNKYVFQALTEKLETDESLKQRFSIRKGVERFEPESILIKVFDFGLRILVNPYDMLNFRQLMQELKLPENGGYGNHKDKLLSMHQTSSEVLNREALLLLVELWGKLDRNPKWLGEAIQNLKKRIDSRELMISNEEAPKVVHDLNELQKFWNVFLRKEVSENQTIANFRYFLALNGSKEIKEELVLATVHTTKGLEFEIVFLMGMSDGIFPDYRSKSVAQLREERNNVYVAVTRAKRALYMTYSQKKLMPWGDVTLQKISRFIKDFV